MLVNSLQLKCVLLIWVIYAFFLPTAFASEERVETVLQSYLQAWQDHDIEKIGAHFASDVIWYDLPSDSSTAGKSAVTQAITTAFMGYVPDMFWVKSGDTFVSGNSVIYEWTYGGTFDGSWGDKMITEKSFSIKGISTTTINDAGKIVSQKDYYDLYGFQQQLGLFE